jgi:hypothetical protein
MILGVEMRLDHGFNGVIIVQGIEAKVPTTGIKC